MIITYGQFFTFVKSGNSRVVVLQISIRYATTSVACKPNSAIILVECYMCCFIECQPRVVGIVYVPMCAIELCNTLVVASGEP